MADLKRAYDVVVLRRKDTRDTSGRWFDVASVESSVVGESSGQQAVRISNVVEVGQVEYLPQSVCTIQAPSKSFSIKSPGKGKQRKSETPAKTSLKRRFEFGDESVVLPKGRGVYFDDPNFACALKSQEEIVASRRSGRIRHAAPVFQLSPR